MRARLEESSRVGLAGLGRVSTAHLEAYAALQNVVVAGAADPSEAARSRASARYGFPCYERLEELLEREPLDLLCVLSPAAFHRSVVETAAAYGVPILCEKPLAATLEDAAAIVETCARAGVPLAYGASARFIAAATAARELVLAGAIGEPSLVAETMLGGAGRAAQEPLGPEHYPEGTPGGASMGLVDHGVHFVDLAPWLLDQNVVSVVGRGNTSGGSLDPEFIALDLDGGAAAHLLLFDGTWSTSLPNEGQWLAGSGWDLSGTYLPAGAWSRDLVELNVYGDEGALRVVPYGHRLYRFGPSGATEVPLNAPPPPHHFGLQLRAILEALNEGDAPPVPGEVGLEALRTLHSVYETGHETLASGGQHVV